MGRARYPNIRSWGEFLVEIIFCLDELYQEGHFLERGAYIHEGAIGLYFGILTEKQLPQSFLPNPKSAIIDQKLSYKEYEDGKKHWYFPQLEDIGKRTLDSYLAKQGNNQGLNNNQSYSNSPMCSNPNIINVQKAAELLFGKKVLMFTGAGISISSGVPDMVKLEQLMIEVFNPTHEFLLEAIENKLEYRLINAKELHRLFVHLEPSVSHMRIADLHNLYGFKLVTGNIDGLHEKTGITPIYYTNENHLVDDLSDYDLLLTIGLGDEGNIGLTDKYRTVNPQGKVIAINRESPLYLGSDDNLIIGDCNEILKQLCNHLRNI